MNDVISLAKHRKKTLREKGRASTLCGNGFHRWKVVGNTTFDVKKGKLVTRYECERCGATRIQAE